MLCLGASAQFVTPSAGTTYTKDNVGVGTSSPSSKLQINSSFGYTGGTYTGTAALKVDWFTPSYYVPGITGTPPNIIEINSNSSFGATPTMQLNAFGQLGLGMIPGSHLLSVEGSSLLKGTLQVGNIALPSGSKMVLDGDLSLTKTSPSAWRNIKAHSSSGALQLAANTGSTDGAAIEMYGNATLGRAGEIRLISYGVGADGGIQFMNFNPITTTWSNSMRILNNGQVYIGNQKPIGSFNDYKLGVDGDVVCKRVVVQTASWADFVFAPDYKLPTLPEVEQYILANKHLPNVPTTTQVTEKGIDLGEMNKILLQKVEELTLYMIELKKENEAIKSAITHLQK